MLVVLDISTSSNKLEINLVEFLIGWWSLEGESYSKLKYYKQEIGHKRMC